jgi:hypothetical protein
MRRLIARLFVTHVWLTLSVITALTLSIAAAAYPTVSRTTSTTDSTSQPAIASNSSIQLASAPATI